MKSAVIFILILASATLAGMSEAELALESSEKAVNEMSAAGFTVTQVNETFKRAKALFLSGDYDSVLLLANQINATKEKAFVVSGKIDGIDSGLVGLAADTTEIEKILGLATAEFYGENYLKAESYADEALEIMEALKSGISVESVSRPRTFYDFLRDNWVLFAFMLLLLAVYRFAFYERIKIKNMRRRLQQLDEMENRTKEALKRAQEDYFARGKTPKYDYHIKVNTYRKHLTAIRKERLVINRELCHKDEILHMLEKLKT